MGRPHPFTAARERAAIPLGRAARPREIGRLLADLASADADYVTGQSFMVDGGLTIAVGQGA